MDRAIDSNPRATPLERPIESYSDDKLERWAMRRLSVDEFWKSDCRSTVRTRSFNLPHWYLGVGLIDGGRWMLIMHEGGDIRAVDLDHPNMPCRNLISLEAEIKTWPIVSFLTDTCPDGLTLTFSVAVLRRAHSQYSRLCFCVFNADNEQILEKITTLVSPPTGWTSGV